MDDAAFMLLDICYEIVPSVNIALGFVDRITTKANQQLQFCRGERYASTVRVCVLDALEHIERWWQLMVNVSPLPSTRC